LHIGILHLGMNMYFLASLSGLIESMWGRWRFLAIYFIAAITGSCAVLSFDLMHERNVYTAGASGALCGLFGSMLVWFAFNRQFMPEQLSADWARTIAVNTILLIGVSLLSNVSWQGHLGGAIGGALAGCVYQLQRFHPSGIVRLLAFLAAPLVPALALAAVLWQAGWFSPLPA
jgi:rhomboid protease GluP